MVANKSKLGKNKNKQTNAVISTSDYNISST